MKEQKFKVGESYNWTPELIKELPHGTVLNCAVIKSDEFTYSGQKVEPKSCGDLAISFKRLDMYFTGCDHSEFAKIISLPPSYLNQFKEKDWSKCSNEERLEYARLNYPVGTKCKGLFPEQETEFITEIDPEFYFGDNIAGKKNMGVIFLEGQWAEIVSTPVTLESIKEIKPKEDFKAGDLVEVHQRGQRTFEFIHSFKGDAWIKGNSDSTEIVPLSFISKPIDKDRLKVEELLKGSFRYQLIGDRLWIVEEDVEDLILEAIKYGRENK